jgi:hypothetical protein
MHASLFKICLFAILVIFPCLAMGRLPTRTAPCSAALADIDFWNSPSPIMVSNKTESLPLLFSHDTEIFWSDAIRFVNANMTKNQVESFFRRLRFSAKSVADGLGLSMSQLRNFAIRNPKVKRSKFLRLTDLNPHYAGLIVQNYDGWLGLDLQETMNLSDGQIDDLSKFREVIGDQMLGKFCRKRGLAVTSECDNAGVEIKHESFEKILPRLAEEMTRVKNIFPRSMSHYHVGLPAAIIDQDKGLLMARVTEMLVILRSGKVPPEDLERLNPNNSLAAHYTASTLVAENDTERGYVRYQPERWTDTVPSAGMEEKEYHDLEVRRYDGDEDAHDQVSLVIELALLHGRLRTIPDKIFEQQVRGQEDPSYINNMSGALRLARWTLKTSKVPEYQVIAEKLTSSIKQMERGDPERAVSLASRRAVARIINRYDLDKILRNPELYTK